MWIFLVIIAILAWGMLSRNSASHPINAVTSQNLPVTACSIKNTVGDSFNSGCTPAAGVPEPPVCHLAIPVCHAIHVQFPVDPPPLQIQKPVPVTVAPIRIFPVPVGYHNNILPARTAPMTVASIVPVRLPQSQPTSAELLALKQRGYKIPNYRPYIGLNGMPNFNRGAVHCNSASACVLNSLYSAG